MDKARCCLAMPVPATLEALEEIHWVLNSADVFPWLVRTH